MDGTQMPGSRAETIEMLRELERKVLWLSSWMIHNANHIRPSRDGLKVGGHQASSASVATLMAALYFNVLRPEDRIAVNLRRMLRGKDADFTMEPGDRLVIQESPL